MESNSGRIKAFAPDLVLRDGIWAGSGTFSLSYPEDGNQKCFELEKDSYWFRHRNDCIAAALLRVGPVGTLLDVGGGNGFVSRRLLDEGHDVILLEPGQEGARNARVERGIPDVICSTLEGARIAAGSLDAVGTFDVIEHLEDDSAFVGEIRRILRPGGLFIGTVPAHGWLWSGSDGEAGHHRRYSRKMLGQLLADGFQAIYVTHIFRALVLPVLLARALPYRIGYRRKFLLGERTEHGAGDGSVAKWITALLAGEVAMVSAGGASSLGTTLLFVARGRC